MAQFILVMVVISIVVEAVTEIITSSELTKPLRGWWSRLTYSIDEPPQDTYYQSFKIWFDKLIGCGYCTSVWVAGFFNIWSPNVLTGDNFVDWLINTFSTHRIATWIHVIYELVRKGRVQSHEISLKLDNQFEESVEGEFEL